MTKRTKILCTIGPAVNNLASIEALIEAGMNTARLNFSHGSHEQHRATINLLKEARKRAKKPLAILLDTKGPEVRVGRLIDDQVRLEKGQRIQIVGGAEQKTLEALPIHPPEVLTNIDVGMRVLLDDGYISCLVLDKEEDVLHVEVENGGTLKSGKGVNIPNAILDLPAMTERDIEDIKFGCDQGVDIIAASFIRSADHVMAIKKLLSDVGSEDTLIIAKIENTEGIQNFDSILQASDGIMIARGDLGVELPLSEVPRLQKMMIRKCYLAGKPSITATQMLESMISCPRPTRAEASDVANAIYDSTSAVMLSGETAVGRYPIETVKVMRDIIEASEKDFDFLEFFLNHTQHIYPDVPSSLTLATVKTAYSSNAKAIFACTSSGSTARLIARLRPKMPIIALTTDEKSYHQMGYNWGVIPCLNKSGFTTEREAFKVLSQFALDQGLVDYGDLVVLTAGSPFGISGTTNMMIVESIGDVLVRGHEGYGEKTYGKVIHLLSPDEKKVFQVKDRIIVIPQCNEAFRPFIMQAKGVILQNHLEDTASEKCLKSIAKATGLSCIIRTEGAYKHLKEGQIVTLDPEPAIVIKGVSS